jgi:hypothetical protein
LLYLAAIPQRGINRELTVQETPPEVKSWIEIRETIVLVGIPRCEQDFAKEKHGDGSN